MHHFQPPPADPIFLPMRRDEEMLLDIEARVTAVLKHLGLTLKRTKCKNTSCVRGRSPAGGYCMDCGGSGHAYEVSTSGGDGSS